MRKTIHGQDQKIFRLLLRHLRTQAGFRQEDLARKLGQAQSFVSKYEMGERRLDLIELRQICHKLGVSLHQFTLMLEKQLSKGTLAVSWVREKAEPYGKRRKRRESRKQPT